MGVQAAHQAVSPERARGVQSVLAASAALALAIAAATLPPLVVLACLAGIGLFVVSLIRPAYGLAILALAVPFGSMVEIPLGGLRIGAVEAVVGIVLLAWLAAVLSRRESQVSIPSQAIPALLFASLIALEMTFSAELAPGLKELLRWVELSAVAILAANIIRSRRDVVILVGALLAAGGMEATIGLAQFLFGLGPAAFRVGAFLRAYGTFNQPNPFAGYLGMVFPLAVSVFGYWLVGWQRGRRGFGLLAPSPSAGEEARETRRPALASHAGGVALGVAPRRLAFGALIVAALSGVAIVSSMSRGAWLGVAVAVVLLAGMYRRRWLGLILVGAVLLVMATSFAQVGVLPGAIGSRLNEAIAYFGVFDVRAVVLTSENWAIVERMASWQAAWRMFEGAPIFGVGPGHYDLAYPDVALAGWPTPLGHAHNYYLNVLAEMGALGLAAYLLVVAGWFAVGSSLFRRIVAAEATCFPSDHVWEGTPRHHLSLERGIAAGALASLAAAAVHNLFDNLYVQGMNVHVGLLLGLLVVVGRPRAEKRAVRRAQ